MRAQRGIRSRTAFTLIEMMVALFLLSMVIAAVYSTWTAILRGAQTGRKAAAEVQRSRMAMAMLEEALSSARSFASDIEYYSFDAENGSKAYLSFVGKLPSSFPRSGRFDPFDVRRLTFSLEAGKDQGDQLVLRQTPLLKEMNEDEDQHPIVLARNLKGFEMEFWDKRKGDWLDEWTETNQLPPMVKVTLQFAQDGNGSRVRDELTRVVALPSITVPMGWQAPGARPAGPIQTVRPGQNPPGVLGR